MKVTSNSYRLPEFYALEPIKEFGTGVNKPVLMRCTDKLSGKREDIVVKLKDGERMGDGRAHANELMGAWLARQMNILVPEPCIVDISFELFKSARGTSFYGRLQKSIGINYGSKYLFNLTKPDLNTIFNRSQVIDAQRIFLFDLMVMNPDRTPEKINILSDSERLYAIDHELAFTSIPFLFPPRRNPWELNKGDIDMVKNGILRTFLASKNFDEEPFIQDIFSITKPFWEKSINLLPNEWYWEYWPNVSKYIQEIVDNAENFVTNARRTL